MAKYVVKWAYMRNPIKPIAGTMPFATKEEAREWLEYNRKSTLNYWIDRIES